MGQIIQHHSHPPTAVAALLRRLGTLPGVQTAVLAADDGRLLASWRRLGDQSLDELAPLAASSLAATVMVGRVLGSPRPSSLLIQEHGGSTVLIAPAGEGRLLLIAVEGAPAMGQLRLEIRRAVRDLEALGALARVDREGRFSAAGRPCAT